MKIKNIALCSISALTLTSCSLFTKDVEPYLFDDLIISEYYEGSGYDKAIELFNGTGETLYLSNYKMKVFLNDDETPTEISLSGTLKHNENLVYVYYNDNSTIDLTSIDNFKFMNVNFNGDDEIYLVNKEDNVISQIGLTKDTSSTTNKDLKDVSLEKTDDKLVDVDNYKNSYDVVSKHSLGSTNFTIKDVETNANEDDELSNEVINYYKDVVNLTGSDLKRELNLLISGHTEYEYTDTTTDTWDILRILDQDPNNPENVLTLYSNESILADCQDGSSTTGCLLGKWNREHVWSKSRGDFGIVKGAGTDVHHLYAEDKTLNSLKNNRYFADCNDGDDTNIEIREAGNYTCNNWDFEPRDEVKGDVARMIFYMAVRYEGLNGEVDLEVVNDPYPDNLPQEDENTYKEPLYGNLDDLLKWHIEDPVSDREIRRNNLIYTDYQGNRNPFIDYPEFVSKVFE